MERTREELILELQRQSILIEKLKQEKSNLSESNRDLAEQNIQLNEQKKSLEDLILFLKRKPFLSKSEVLSDEQMNLFNEAEVESIKFDSNDDVADLENPDPSDKTLKLKKKNFE